MAKKKISGTTDWYRYSIKLDYPEDAEKIIIGGILSGDGEAWFDDFAIFIDGKNILDLEISETKTNKILNNDKINKAANIQIDSALSQIQIKNLKTLGLVWGFLKYYHPNIAKGKYDWDIELLKFFQVFQAKDEQSKINNIVGVDKKFREITEFNKKYY